MFLNKFTWPVLITIGLTAVILIWRENSANTYFSCIANVTKSKKLDDRTVVLSNFVTINLESGGKGRIQLQGYLTENNQVWKINRIFEFTFRPQKNSIFYLFDFHSQDVSPDDSVPDKLFDEMSDIHLGKIIYGVRAFGVNTLVFGDSLQPRLVCIKKE